MVQVKLSLSLLTPSLAVTMTLNVPETIGVPPISPVDGLIDTPDGRPLALKTRVSPLGSVAESCTMSRRSRLAGLISRIGEDRRDRRIGICRDADLGDLRDRRRAGGVEDEQQVVARRRVASPRWRLDVQMAAILLERQLDESLLGVPAVRNGGSLDQGDAADRAGPGNVDSESLADVDRPRRGFDDRTRRKPATRRCRDTAGSRSPCWCCSAVRARRRRRPVRSRPASARPSSGRGAPSPAGDRQATGRSSDSRSRRCN